MGAGNMGMWECGNVTVSSHLFGVQAVGFCQKPLRVHLAHLARCCSGGDKGDVIVMENV